MPDLCACTRSASRASYASFVVRSAIGLALIITLTVLAAGAQEPPRQPGPVIVGTVTDTLGAALPYCSVAVENPPSAVLCDSLGGFRVAGLSRQMTTFEVRRLGYVPGRFSVIIPGDSLRAIVQLVPLPTVLSPIDVTAAGASEVLAALAEHGFYERMRVGATGMFITPEELERLRPERVTEALRDRPGIRITFGGIHGNEPIPLIWGRNFCLLNVFVDGLEINGIYDVSDGARRGGVDYFGKPGWPGSVEQRPTVGVGLDAFIRPDAIAAIEIYLSGPATPIQFRTTNECGAIVIWTKMPEAKL